MKQLIFIFLLTMALPLSGQIESKFDYLDVFQLEYANQPLLSPNGAYIIYERTGFDIMKDGTKKALWIVSTDEKGTHHKLTSREVNEGGAQWSPNGDRIAFVSKTEEGSEIYVYWTATGNVARLTQLEQSPSNLAWSPDGKQIAFTMTVKEKPPVLAKMPEKPKGAKWADTPRITDRLKHEADGSGYIDPGFTHIFLIPAEGGSPRQVTSGAFNHGGNLSWSKKGHKIFFSGNRNPNWEYEFRNSEVYAIDISTGQFETLTDRQGPDDEPKVSPDGTMIAYLGYEDKVQAYQVMQLQVMDVNGTQKRVISKTLDRDITTAEWAADSKGFYVQYNDWGLTKIGYMDLNGKLTEYVDNVGGTSLGRPYSGGSFSVSQTGKITYTISYPNRPADVALLEKPNAKPKVLTALNEDLLQHKKMASVKEVRYKSSVDGRDLQGWLMYPTHFDENKKYPLIVENHGGPILNYGPFFSAELQLFAAQGYFVFFPNPRGSTSYGEEFGNLLFNNYPGEDYNDVMDGVDEVLKIGKINSEELFVTGGSAGGIMTAWIIGKTHRFKAAVVVKPVMNWISKTLTADNYFGYADSRYPGQPWENFENYWKFSPISLVGNVETPTMVMVGMNDLRTPPSEAKQLYHALKLRKIETVLVEIPEASHGIANRPSNLITKVAHILAWFDKYKDK